MEISLQQLILIVGTISGLVWYFSRCDTQRWIKFHINWWLNHDLIRWCDHAETRLENWNKKMTKLRWLLFSIGLISMFFIPVTIWSETLADEEKSLGGYGTMIFLIEYFGLSIWIGIGIYGKKPQHSNVNVVEKSN